MNSYYVYFGPERADIGVSAPADENNYFYQIFNETQILNLVLILCCGPMKQILQDLNIFWRELELFRELSRLELA
jgi:hypothetical protein